ncbi:hypothetical protein ACVWW7_006679 [Bradyrhizobium sp. LM6.9]
MTASITSTEPQDAPVTSGFWGLTLGSIGVVFGDIGTSPLYAFHEAVRGAAHGAPVSRVMVLGVLSLILWALLIVVTAKYVLLLLRADNNGEGGTLSLMALGQRALGRRSWFLMALGVVGASMFIGDSMITPAISVLSAVEGLKLATPAFEHYVVPLTVFILALLFAVQSKGDGTGGLGLWPSDGDLVHRSCRARHHSHRRRPVGACCHQSLLRAAIPAVAWHDRPGDTGRRVPGCDRWRGALCRSRPFRPQADPVGLDVLRAALAPDQLFRAGRAGAVRSQRDRALVLPHGARAFRAAAGRTCDRGDRDCEPGGDHGGLFAGLSGCAARALAALRGAVSPRKPTPARSICRV